jgi:hypothetical protein
MKLLYVYAYIQMCQTKVAKITQAVNTTMYMHQGCGVCAKFYKRLERFCGVKLT